MKTLFRKRLVAILLVPCLLAEPSTAALSTEFRGPSRVLHSARYSLLHTGPLFSSQALALESALPSTVMSGPIKPTQEAAALTGHTLPAAADGRKIRNKELISLRMAGVWKFYDEKTGYARPFIDGREIALERRDSLTSFGHLTATPLSVLEWIFQNLPVEGKVVFSLGSGQGPELAAAVAHGAQRAVGIEGEADLIGENRSIIRHLEQEPEWDSTLTKRVELYQTNFLSPQVRLRNADVIIYVESGSRSEQRLEAKLLAEIKEDAFVVIPNAPTGGSSLFRFLEKVSLSGQPSNIDIYRHPTADTLPAVPPRGTLMLPGTKWKIHQWGTQGNRVQKFIAVHLRGFAVFLIEDIGLPTTDPISHTKPRNLWQALMQGRLPTSLWLPLIFALDLNNPLHDFSLSAQFLLILKVVTVAIPATIANFYYLVDFGHGHRSGHQEPSEEEHDLHACGVLVMTLTTVAAVMWVLLGVDHRLFGSFQRHMMTSPFSWTIAGITFGVITGGITHRLWDVPWSHLNVRRWRRLLHERRKKSMPVEARAA